MKILLTDLGKRYNREWIFRHLNYTFQSPNAYAIIGPNGSGKSTLLQIIGGAIGHSEGRIEYLGQKTDSEAIFKEISIAAPYLEVIEEMTLREFLAFHRQFKPFMPGLDLKGIMNAVGLDRAADKQIRYFSSGMKQRVKLAQAIFSDTPLLLLDEPCTNLDASGVELYQELIDRYAKDKLVIVSSNVPEEYRFCQYEVSIIEYKHA